METRVIQFGRRVRTKDNDETDAQIIYSQISSFSENVAQSRLAETQLGKDKRNDLKSQTFSILECCTQISSTPARNEGGNLRYK